MESFHNVQTPKKIIFEMCWEIIVTGETRGIGFLILWEGLVSFTALFLSNNIHEKKAQKGVERSL